MLVSYGYRRPKCLGADALKACCLEVSGLEVHDKKEVLTLNKNLIQQAPFQDLGDSLDGGVVSAAVWISFLLVKIAFTSCTCHSDNARSTSLNCVLTLRLFFHVAVWVGLLNSARDKIILRHIYVMLSYKLKILSSD
jgi:hypothetical protein